MPYQPAPQSYPPLSADETDQEWWGLLSQAPWLKAPPERQQFFLPGSGNGDDGSEQIPDRTTEYLTYAGVGVAALFFLYMVTR